MENFQAETTDLLAADGAIQASEPQALLPTIRELLDSPQRVAQLGENGRKLIENNRDMAERYLHELERLCPTTFNNQA
jgi:3-deoxy-D-manno-octulosonic-acid transferase